MITVITLFSGYDSQCLALNRLGIDYNLAAWCEIDKHAITAHNALFPQWADRNLGDVSKVDWEEWHRQHPEQIDLLTYSSPCQDFSSAGLQRGGEEGSGTRSGLLWETERAVRELRPRYLVFENVGGLVSDKFIALFQRWQVRLNNYGYTNFQQLMNAKDYGVPQNRLRIFMVSVYDCKQAYYFPKPFPLTRRLKDVLEQNVEERYYLSDDNVRKMFMFNEDRKNKGMNFHFSPHNIEDDYASSIMATTRPRQTDNYIQEQNIQQIGNLYNNEGNPQSERVYSSDGVSPTVDASAPKHNRRVYITESQMLGWTRNEKGEIIDRHPVGVANCVTAFKRDNTQNYIVESTIARHAFKIQECQSDVPQTEPCCHQVGNIHEGESNPQSGRVYSADGLAPTLDCCQGGNREPKIIEDFYGTVREPRVYDEEAPTLRADRSGLMATEGIRVRRLTERELYRLMDVEEKDIDTLLAAHIPRTQHAKLAGNSIVVACLYYIFRKIFVENEPQDGEQLMLF